MKQSTFLATLIIFAHTVFSQNVGIGEPNPLVKLTVRSTGLQSSLLVKNGDDDSVMLSAYRNVYVGGYHSTAGGVLSISNKHYLPFDPAQLELVAAGERSGINANGSLNTIRFSNVNSNKVFSINAYTGSSAADRSFMLSHYDPDEGVSRTLIYFKPDGRTGIGTFQPTGRLQINHTSSAFSPTLNLLDSSGVFGPIIQFGNRGGSDYWQMRSIIDFATPTSTYLEFATQSATRMTLRGDGNLGIGIANPGERLDVSGNVRITGEVNRNSTGVANLVPIAYGTVLANGTINSGSGNFTVSHVITGFYDITITGENYIYSGYSTVATPVSGTTPVFAGTSSGSGRLHIYLHSIAGADVDGIFSFVVYKQ